MSPVHEPTAIPFSIVLETENLRGAEIEELFRCLESLDAQSVHPSRAAEVLLINSDVVPPEIVAEIGRRYAWVRVVPLPPGFDYYASKRRGAELASGDVVVFCDGDCEYSPEWLGELLKPFADDPAVSIVTGETATSVSGPVELGLSASYIFPFFSNRTELIKAGSYQYNNVAFRRSLLLRHPTPSGVPCYRGNGLLHAFSLVHDGHTIWQNPKARVFHPLPESWGLLARRYVLLGQEAYVLSKIKPGWVEKRELRWQRSAIGDLWLCARIGAGRARTAFSRMAAVVSSEPRRVVYLPITFPIACASLFLFLLGVGISYVSPTYLIRKLGG
jgi:glycosyltransferase involved in cell wall biosynthesis